MDWQEPNNDPLDELLRSAHWPERDQAVAAKLEQRWQRVRRQRRFVERARILGASFTLLVLFGGTITWRLATVDPPVPSGIDVASEDPPDQVHAPSTESVVAERDVRSIPAAFPAISRVARPYELAILRREREARANEKRQREKVSPVETEMDTDTVEEIVARLVANRDEDVHAAAVALDKSQPNAETQLLQLVEESRGATQGVALRLLANLATRESLMVLVNHSLRARCPDEVSTAIERLCETQELAELAYRANTSARRQVWIAAILRRDATQSTPVYLALLRDPQITADAVAVIADAENPPIEGLFAALASPDKAERLVAARALAARNDPAVSTRLAQIVMQDNARREALVALLMSKDRVAGEFLAYARTDLRLWPSVQAVSAQFASVLRLN